MQNCVASVTNKLSLYKIFFQCPKLSLLLTFQAGPSFDLPDREKMRRYGWSNGNISANGNCVLLETEHSSRGNTTSYMRRPQEVCSKHFNFIFPSFILTFFSI